MPDIEKVLHSSVYAKGRPLLLFGELEELECQKEVQAERAELIKKVIPKDLMEIYRRMGLVSEKFNSSLEDASDSLSEKASFSSLVFHSHFRLDFIIYGKKPDVQESEGNHERKTSIFRFPEIWDNKTTLAFWGQGIFLDNLADETGKSESAAPRVRSLPFGVRLLPSSRPKVEHEDLVITCCFVPEFSSGFPLLLQTIHLFTSVLSRSETVGILLDQVRKNLGLDEIEQSKMEDCEKGNGKKSRNFAIAVLEWKERTDELAKMVLQERALKKNLSKLLDPVFDYKPNCEKSDQMKSAFDNCAPDSLACR